MKIIREKMTAWTMGLMLLLAACSDGSRYVEALPADAALVAAVDVNGMARKAGLLDVEGGTVRTWLKRTLGESLGESEAMLDRLMEDPSGCGLQFTDKVFVFVASGSEYAGALFRVKDVDDLEQFVELLRQQQLCDEVRESDGSSWTLMGGMLAAWSDRAFLIMASPKGEDPARLQRQADRLLRQQEGEGFTATADYARMCETKGEVVTLASLDLFPYQTVLPLTMGLSGDLKLKDVKALAALEFGEGKAVIQIQTQVADKVVQSVLEKQLQVTGPLEGTYLEAFPKKMGAWASFNADGKQLYDFLNENPYVRRLFEHSMIPIDFAAVFGAIHGDVALAMPDPLHSNAFMAYARVTGSGFLQTFEDLKPLLAMTGGQARLINQGEKAYEFRTTDASLIGLPAGPLALWFGVRGDHLYLTNDKRLLDEKVLGLSLANTAWGNRVKGQRFFVAADAAGVWPDAETLTVESADGSNIRVEWVMKDNKTNVLEQLIRRIGLR